MPEAKKIPENSEELLEVMANYKFVLVLEKTVCEGNITIFYLNITDTF